MNMTEPKVELDRLAFRIHPAIRAQLAAIMRHEDRSTESDTVRALIQRAYRQLPKEAQTAEGPMQTAPLDGARR